MKYVIWFNQEEQEFSFGIEEEYFLLKEELGSNIEFQKSFRQVSTSLVSKITRLMNRRMT